MLLQRLTDASNAIDPFHMLLELFCVTRISYSGLIDMTVQFKTNVCLGWCLHVMQDLLHEVQDSEHKRVC